MTTAGVVLAGGRSSRMGAPKAALEWHGSTLLRRTCGVVARAVDGPVVVVRAPDQELPSLPGAVVVRDDPEEGLGPLQGIAVGLAAVTDRADVAFVCSTDMPFLHVQFVRRVLQAMDGTVDVVLPIAHGYPQPLAAAYRTSLAPRVAAMVAARRLRPAFLFDEVATRRLGDTELLADPDLAGCDPGLDSVVNVNEPTEYELARQRPAPEVTVQCFGVHASQGRRGPRRVRAATVGEAAAAVGVPFDRHVLAAVNGDQTSRDEHLPLVLGDMVSFLSADAGG
ncbi:MAG: molybdenum cofactor guanylyltransferase [Actinomycetes bacterium]